MEIDILVLGTLLRTLSLGMWVHANMSPGLDGLSMMLFTKVLGWSEQEVQVLVALARKDMADRRIHAYWPAYTVYAQKPE